MSDIEFLNGISVKAPHIKAPDFVKGSISIKREELISALSEKNEEWINLDIKVSKKGTWYMAINTWKPDTPSNTQANTQAPPSDFDDELPPFM